MSKGLEKRMADMERKLGTACTPEVSVNWDPDPTFTPGTIVVEWAPDGEITRRVVEENGK